MVNIGTLLAFCDCVASVMVCAIRIPASAAFPDAVVPLIPILGVISNGYMMYKLGWGQWARLVIWLIIGLVVYFSYSVKHSRVQSLQPGAGTKSSASDQRFVSSKFDGSPHSAEGLFVL